MSQNAPRIGNNHSQLSSMQPPRGPGSQLGQNANFQHQQRKLNYSPVMNGAVGKAPMSKFATNQKSGYGAGYASQNGQLRISGGKRAHSKNEKYE